MIRVGVLAAQGAFIEHIHVLRDLGVEAVEVRLPEELDQIAGLIIPGGESTTIGKVMNHFGLIEPLRRLALSGFPIYGTCAGLILLAKDIGPFNQPILGVMDIKVKRNAFGRQLDSFEAELPIPALGEEPFHAVFIRAPIVESVGPDVEVLANLPGVGHIAVRQNNLLGSAFHPELSKDQRFHRYFLDMIEKSNDPSYSADRSGRVGVLQ